MQGSARMIALKLCMMYRPVFVFAFGGCAHSRSISEPTSQKVSKAGELAAQRSTTHSLSKLNLHLVTLDL